MSAIKHAVSALAAASSSQGKAVSEYLIAPPREPIYRNLAVLERLRAHMAERFPSVTFDIRSDFPFGHPIDFVALPVMGVSHPTEPDRFLMCRAPTEAETDGLYAALEAFDPLAKPASVH